MRTTFAGIGTALVTPFTRKGDLDEPAIRRLARRQIDAGIHFLVPCGTTGETPTLSLVERRRVVEIVVEEAAGRCLVLAGAGGNDTRQAIDRATELTEVGANGLLVATPYYNKPSPEGLYQHYKAIAGVTELPIVLYNVPGRTGCNIDPATLSRLAEIPNIIGIKEASGNMQQVVDFWRVVPDDFHVLAGDDWMTLPLMAVGGRGVISVASNQVPAEMLQMVLAAESGDFAEARRWFARLIDLMKVNFAESNPGPVKFSMAAMGLCEEVFRLPIVTPTPATQSRILAVMRDFGLPIVTEAPLRKASG